MADRYSKKQERTRFTRELRLEELDNQRQALIDEESEEAEMRAEQDNWEDYQDLSYVYDDCYCELCCGGFDEEEELQDELDAELDEEEFGVYYP
jgi:hypothetical protein